MRNKEDMPEGWADIGSDMNWQAYGGKWARQSKGGAWYVIEVINMDDACGRDNEGHDHWIVELKQVDLREISKEQLDSAIESCGLHDYVDEPDESDSPEEKLRYEMSLVEACQSYGIYSPLESFSGGQTTWSVYVDETEDEEKLLGSFESEEDAETAGKAWEKAKQEEDPDNCDAYSYRTEETEPDEAIVEDLRKQAIQAAADLDEDEDALDDLLDRPVNKIGSTAREFGRGDLDAAMGRAVDAAARGEAVSPEMSVMLKIQYKLSAVEIAEVAKWDRLRSEDMLPFMFAYMDAMREGADLEALKSDYNKRKKKKDAYAESYLAGILWAEYEKAGKLGKPAGIK